MTRLYLFGAFCRNQALRYWFAKRVENIYQSILFAFWTICFELVLQYVVGGYLSQWSMKSTWDQLF